jgi:FkbM family methyltransferase
MSFRKNFNRLLKPLLGYELTKPHFGNDLWPDVKTVLARGEIATVIDVGANEGQSAHEFLGHFPRARIYSFEPAPAAFQTLSTYAQAHPRVTAVNKALGEVAGKAEFHENGFHQTNSFLPAAARSGEYFGANVLGCRNKIEVEVTTLDNYCRQQSIGQIDLLKIDVQGFELSVLKGATELLAGKKIGCIVLELTFVPLYENQATLHDLAALLGKYEYDVAGFYDFAQSRQNHLMWCDAMFHPRR